MSETKFTPGPWHAFGDSVKKGRYVVAKVNAAEQLGIVESSERAAHNAHLIAAAPQMYEALEDLLDEVESLVASGDAGREPILLKFREAAHAALKAARGEQ